VSRRVDDRVKRLEAKASKPRGLTNDEADAIVEAALEEYRASGVVSAGRFDGRKPWERVQATEAIAEALGIPASAVVWTGG